MHRCSAGIVDSKGHCSDTFAVVIFIDGNDLRAAEIRRIAPNLELVVEALPTGFATSSPEPEHRARDKVLAHPVIVSCFAEAVDITTMDGKSLRLELDSENESRFTRWWRETPAQMLLRIAYRRAGAPDIGIIAGSCDGRIAARPQGPQQLGWDRLFVPAEYDRTLAELCLAGEPAAFRVAAYNQLLAGLGT